MFQRCRLTWAPQIRPSLSEFVYEIKASYDVPRVDLEEFDEFNFSEVEKNFFIGLNSSELYDFPQQPQTLPSFQSLELSHQPQQQQQQEFLFDEIQGVPPMFLN